LVPERQTIPNYSEVRNNKLAATNWTTCKSFALHSRQITTPAPQYSFKQAVALPAYQ